MPRRCLLLFGGSDADRCHDGRFMPRTESGIPPMPGEKVLAYLRILKKYRQPHGTNA